MANPRTRKTTPATATQDIPVPEVLEQEQPKAQKGVLLLVNAEGQLVIQNAKDAFTDQIAEDMDDETFTTIIKNLHRQIEVTELVRAVKAELAK